MKSAFAYVTLILLCSLSGTALAADWVPLATPGSPDQYSYDRSKLTIKDDEVTYWKKVVFSTPQNLGGRDVTSGLLREQVHCVDHTAKLISYLYYSATGETVDYVAKVDADPTPIIPDSVGDAYESKLCPIVWQKQEENRIKAQQKAAQAELAAALKEKEKECPPPPQPPAPSAATPERPTAAPSLPELKPAPALPMPQIEEQLY